MGRKLTGEQVKTEMSHAMPGGLGELYYDLWNEVAWIHLKWNDFLGLFAESPKTIELLRETAPKLFYRLRNMLWESVFLHLCRLTDPPESCGKPNQSLRRLPARVAEPGLRACVKSLVDDAVEKTKFARDWRNRRLAHKELPAPPGQQPKPLAHASRQCVEAALTSIREAMHCVELHYQKSSTVYERCVEGSGGIESLLFYLRKGVDSQRREDEVLRRGTKA